jgi:hypothetical protein
LLYALHILLLHSSVKTPEALQLLFVQIVLAQDEKEVMRLLLADSDSQAS